MKSQDVASTKPRELALLFLMPLLFLNLFLAGCSGGTSASTSSTGAAGGVVYAYQGVSNVTPALEAAYVNPPSWTFVLGQAESSFRYNDAYALYQAAAGVYVSGVTSGSYSSDNGYLSLTALTNTVGSTTTVYPLAAQGYALTIPGEAALLRPGDITTPPVVTVGMTNCAVVSSAETFLFVALPGVFWNASSSAAYGSIKATTDVTGSTWSFSDQSQSLLAGSGSTPSYPASFTGTCGQGVDGYSIGVVPTPAQPYNNPIVSVSPSGFFTETATGSPASSTTNVNEVQQPLVGVVAPSAQLSTTSVAGAKYLGFEYESLAGTQNAPPTATQLVSFGSTVAASGSTMTGGVFPKDDPSQTPAANITVNFGTQSSTQNGLYTSVTVTIPDTSTIAGTCAKNGGTPGSVASGGLTCSFAAIAIVGNPTGKFAIFLIGQDPTQNNAPFGLYLYQQQ